MGEKTTWVWLIALLLAINMSEGVILVPSNGTYPIASPPVSSNITSTNQTDYWGTYYYTLFADYPNWNEAYGWGNPSGVYLPLVGGTISGGLTVNGGITSNERIKLTQTSTTAFTVTDDADVIKFIINTQANTISTVKLIPTIDAVFDIGEADGETGLRYRNLYLSGNLTNGEDATISLGQIINGINSLLVPSTTNGYLRNDSDYIYFNETKLNQTISALEIDTDTVWNISTSNYLYNNSGILYFNETKMNNTVNSFGFLKADGSVPLTSQWNYGAFNINGSGNYSQQNLTISQNSTTVKFNTGGKGWCIGNCP
jgi:hypothetical protein